MKINYPSGKDDWNSLKKNNTVITLNVLYAKKEEKISYISKHNSNCEKRIMLSMISNGERWHYLVINNCLYYEEG